MSPITESLKLEDAVLTVEDPDQAHSFFGLGLFRGENTMVVPVRQERGHGSLRSRSPKRDASFLMWRLYRHAFL